MKPYFFYTDELTVGYDGKPLIKKINIEVNQGEILTLIGPNGAGKSTILKSITKQLAAVGGCVWLDKQQMSHMSAKEMAKKLADLIRGMGAHVNLIPINPVDGSPYSATDEANVRRFQKMLEDLGVNATIRRRLGTDISAACGQLRREDAKQAEQATRQTTSERTNAQ